VKTFKIVINVITTLILMGVIFFYLFTAFASEIKQFFSSVLLFISPNFIEEIEIKEEAQSITPTTSQKKREEEKDGWWESYLMNLKIFKTRQDPRIKNNVLVEITIPAGFGRKRGKWWKVEEIAQELGMKTEHLIALNKDKLQNLTEVPPGTKLKTKPYSDFNVVKVTYYSEGELMANGKPFNPNDPSIAANKFLPFGLVVRMTNIWTGKSQIVIIQDRGPGILGRQFDVSQAAKNNLNFGGMTYCTVEILRKPRS